MSSNKTKAFLWTVLACAGVANLGCDELDTTTAGLVSCAPGTMRLEGVLDGMSIAIAQTSDTGGWAQTDEGEFGSLNNTRDREPSLADVQLQWQSRVTGGRSTPVTGVVVLPTGGPFAGETLCVGEGSIVRSAGDGQLQWVLENLRGGSGCAVPITGELQGCFQSRP